MTKRVKALDGWAPKWVSPGAAGVPDRMILLPRGRVGFLELKAPGESPTPLQLVRLETLRALGMRVGWADEHAGVERFLDQLDV